MDKLSAEILKGLMPAEPAVTPAPKARKDEGGAHHFAPQILLERAAYLKQMARLSEGTASEVLNEYPRHNVQLLHRGRSGGAEIHEQWADIFLVLEGHGIMTTGGTVIGGKSVAPGEIRGERVEGGKLQELKRGELIHIPAGLPHQMLVKGEESISCLVLKVRESGDAE